MMVDGAGRFDYVLRVLVVECRHKCRASAGYDSVLSCAALRTQPQSAMSGTVFGVIPSSLCHVQQSDLMLCHLAEVLDSILRGSSVWKAWHVVL